MTYTEWRCDFGVHCETLEAWHQHRKTHPSLLDQVHTEHPWLVPDAERLEALVGFTVIAAPNGPLGPKYLGRLERWELSSDRILAWVDTVDEGLVDCWSYDVTDARQPLVAPGGDR